MGALGGSNGDWPHEGQPDGLSGLPPEWGTIVIPDDASELAAEAEEVRRELHHDVRRQRWRRRFGLASAADSDEPSIGLPLLIMAIAIVATLTSLFAVAWSRPAHTPVAGGVPPSASARSWEPAPVPEVTLDDYRGADVALRDHTPAVLVFVDGCACQQFVLDVADAGRGRFAIFPISQQAVEVVEEGLPAAVRYLVDPTARARAALALDPPRGAATVALVSRSGVVLWVLPETRTVDDFRTKLDALI